MTSFVQDAFVGPRGDADMILYQISDYSVRIIRVPLPPFMPAAVILAGGILLGSPFCLSVLSLKGQSSMEEVQGLDHNSCLRQINDSG